MFWIDDGNVGRIDFQLCHSRDGKRWVRDPERAVFLPNGPEGAWDSGDMRAACRSVILPSKVLIYYAGSQARHGMGAKLNLGMDIGLATLRRDGWVSLDAGSDTATLVTKPFVHPGGDLYINADAAAGRMVVSVLDAAQQPIAGYEESLPITGDSLQVKPTFSRPLAALAGRSLRLQFRLRETQLYAFWFD